jgi:hypothetical protein
MKFIMKADVVFGAESIDDAFLKVAEHFMYLLTGEGEDPELFESGSIIIEPKK